MASPLFFPICVSQILIQAKLESYLTFPLGLLNLLDGDPSCDTIPKSEREEGVLPVIIVSHKSNTPLRQGVTPNTFPLTIGKASWALESARPAVLRGKALCSPFLLTAYRFKSWTLHFKCRKLYICLRLRSAQTNMNSTFISNQLLQLKLPWLS